ncbi:coiled-coil domain-containing protein, partial [Clarias magur]
MSRSLFMHPSVGASHPLLHRRLLVAEGQGAELAKKLGVARDELGTEFTDGSRSEALVARVCRLESLLHTLRLGVFRIETARELNSSHTACLQEQLASLQEQCDEERCSSQREAMRLRDQLQQEREEAQREAHTLRNQLRVSHTSQTDVALAAKELKKIKTQLSRKLQQMKEELAQETSSRLEAEQSHYALLRRVKELEGEVEKEKEEVKCFEADCHTLSVDGQEVKAELEEKLDLIQSLEKECQQLQQQIEEKDVLASDLCAKLKSMRRTLQQQQQENSTLLRDREELKVATNKVQGLNDQLEAQCSDLSSALRSLTEEKAQLQASLKVEQERTAQHVKNMDLQLDTAKRNMQHEVQEALADRRLLQKELGTLRVDHTKLQQSSAAALDAAVSHQELLERTIRHLRGELRSATKEREAMQRGREEVCTELECLRTTSKSLQEQLIQISPFLSLSLALSQLQEELQVKECHLCLLRSETEYIQRENLRLKNQLQNTHTKKSETLQTELGDKLNELHILGRQREAELHKAKQEINQLTKQVDELQRAKHHGRKSAQLEVCEAQSLEQLRVDVASLQAELHDLSSSQQEALQAERCLTHTLQEKCKTLVECVAKLKEEKNEAEQKMTEVRLASQQISENLQDAHSWFRSKFDSLRSGLGHNRAPLQEQTGVSRDDINETSAAHDTSE